MDKARLGRTVGCVVSVWTLLLVGAVSCQPERSDTTQGAMSAFPAYEAIMPISHFPEKLDWADPAVCAECHQEAHEDWLLSHHAIANRPLDATLDAAPFAVAPMTDEAGDSYVFLETEDGYALQQTNAEPATPLAEPQEVAGVIGIEPLWQYLVPKPGGRLQTHALTWDPNEGEWFNVFGEERRFPDEWGHWTQQGMNWNANCAYCHMTGYAKNFDLKTNSYNSQWVMQTVSCIQCHEGMEQHVTDARQGIYTTVPEAPSAALNMESCASCHSRREELTADGFHAGERYHDHYRLVLPDQPYVYFADGQANEENYVYASLMLSTMGHAGVTCFDCHNTHSGRLILNTEDNSLCMRCHSNGLLEAPIIQPLEHSRHAAGSMGNRCVECHMPHRSYMQRDPRRDHGFTSPDPQLTLDHGVPNACNTCHTEESTEWALQHVNDWYGNSERRQAVAHRAGVLERAYAGDLSAAEDILALLNETENTYWRATFLRMLSPLAADPRVQTLARSTMADGTPLERDAALPLLAAQPQGIADIIAAENDPARLVRLRAADLLVTSGNLNMDVLQEWRAYLDANADRPGGALQRAQLAMMEGELDLAAQLVQQAIDLDRRNPLLKYDASVLYAQLQQPQRALDILAEARATAPEMGLLAYAAGLLFVETGDVAAAERALREAVSLDPTQSRWWYNLAILLQQQNKLEDARLAIRRAQALEPMNPQYQQLRRMLGQ